MASNKFLSILSITLIVLASACSNANAQWCDRTTNAALCHSIVDVDPRTNLKTTLEGVGTILKDKAVSTAVSTANKISTLITSTHNKQVVDILNVCSQAYSNAIPILKSADFNHFDYVTLVGDFSDGGDAAHECKTSFQEPGLGPSPVEAEVQSLIDICANVLEIVNLRKCNRPSFC